MIAHVTFVYPEENPPLLRNLRLCVEFAKRHYTVRLHTNLDIDLGCEVERRPFREVAHPFEHKLDTYRLAVAGEPFIHLDSDAFVIQPLPGQLVTAPLFAKCHDGAGFNLAIFGGTRVPDFVAAIESDLAAGERQVAGRFDFKTLIQRGVAAPRGFVHVGNPKPRQSVSPIRREPISRRPPNAVESGKLPGCGEERPAYVVMGRYGDLINLLPVWRDVAATNGKPAVLVSSQFADVFEGVSYVDAIPVSGGYDDIQPAIREGRRRFKEVTVCQVHARGWNPGRMADHYNQDAWRLAGYLPRWSDPTLRLEFDRRNFARERQLIEKHWPKTNLPVLVVNARAGFSSPFPEWQEFQDHLQSVCRGKFEILDVGGIRAARLFDLLGLMDLAAGVISIDTATLHLAGASTAPTIALLSPAGPWRQTGERQPWLLSFPCNEWRSNVSRLNSTLLEIAERPQRIIHAFEWHQTTDPRVARAQATWQRLPWFQVPYRDYARDARQIGDKRALPYLRDVLAAALEHATDSDLVVLTNDDVGLAPELDRIIRDRMRNIQVATGRRVDIPSKRMPHAGRDIAVFRASWLRRNLPTIPDFILGASEWDLWAAAEANRLVGRRWAMRTSTIDQVAEIPTGHVSHETHTAVWTTGQNSFPSQLHNRRLFKAWCLEHGVEGLPWFATV